MKTMQNLGPITVAADRIHAEHYRGPGESFREAMTRVANVLSDDQNHFQTTREILSYMRFMPGGRIQSAIGSLQATTAYNCFVSGTIEDSFVDGSGSIMDRAKQAAATMRMGGGIGYDFSSLRPRGAIIRKLGSASSGPVSFMEIFDAICRATSSAGARRGAQMGVMRVDHPDIEEFIRAKRNDNYLTGFNISVAVTNEFMEAVDGDKDFPLRWGGLTYKSVRARELWDIIMRSNYDWAEPGVLFIDTINGNNNLAYCETIAATNPCGEQPLPPYGACLLGSFNLVKYLYRTGPGYPWQFSYQRFVADISPIVRAMDNVVDIARYPLYEQEKEAKSKRRMGLGVTGVANAIEALGFTYGTWEFRDTLGGILRVLRDQAYKASAELAREKGAFPLYSRESYMQSPFVQSLPDDILDLIAEHGVRNSHLLSIAPTGTISLCADNVSSGIEPVYAYKTRRIVRTLNGVEPMELDDYGVSFLGVRGKTADECTPKDHLGVLTTAAAYMDSAVSKTCNVPNNIPWDDFKEIYMTAWKAETKGCTTYRKGCLREGILSVVKTEEPAEITSITPGAGGGLTFLPLPPGAGGSSGGMSDSTQTFSPSCTYDSVTGQKLCE